MKKLFVKLSVLMFGLLAGTAASWGQISVDMDAMADPVNWYYVTLQARVSKPTCGSNPGEVRLTYTDIQHNVINPWITASAQTVNPYEDGTSEYSSWQDGFRAWTDKRKSEQTYTSAPAEKNEYWYGQEGLEAYTRGYDDGQSWYNAGAALNTANPAEFGATSSLNGFAQIHMEGVDSLMDMLSSYAYFFGSAKENDGWYFTGWSRTEGANDLGGKVGESESTLFKIFPGAEAGITHITTQYVYATFQPVQVASYKVGGIMSVGQNAADYDETTVVFDVKGERVSKADFTVAVDNANFAATIADDGCPGNKVTVTVRFTNPGGLADDTYRGNVTLASKSGCSELTAATYARVSAAADTDASLYDGKTLKQSGSLESMIDAIGTCETPIVSLNRDYAAALTTTASFALDLNGYTFSNSLTVNGGELTIAYSKYGGRITNTVTVQAGKLILNGGEIEAAKGVVVRSGATLEQNGAVISATNIGIENAGTAVIAEGETQGDVAGVKSTGDLTVKGGTIMGTYALWTAGGTAAVQKGTLSGTSYGIYSDATTTTEKLATVYGGTNAVYVAAGTTTINNGKFDAGDKPLYQQSEGTLNLLSGYFKTNDLGVDIPAGKKLLNVSAGTEYNAGYRYYVGDDESAQLSGVGVCKIGTTPYATLEDALAYANNNPNEEVTIIMLNDYVLPAGYYTLPAKATLIVPMMEFQETGYPTINRVSKNRKAANEYIQPYPYRRLTFANGVNLEVHGTIELSGTQRAGDAAYAAMPHGPYGYLVMEAGSHMTLQNGSELRAWGYMTGAGETDARRGSTVREQFQMGDWKGGQLSFNMLSDSRHVFPITQYFIQNIESPVKYHPGAVLSTTASVSAAAGGMSVTAMANDIKIIGVKGVHDAMFLMDNNADADNTWVRKWYDAENDVQTYDVNSAAHIGSMVLDLGSLPGIGALKMNSGYFVLPITNNMKIHLLSGHMDFTQTTALLPGAEVEVDKEATISISKEEGIMSGSLYVYDADQWDTYACGKKEAGGYETGKYTKVVMYSPTIGGQPAKRSETVCPADAKINVHGTFDTDQGYVFTTEGGANIFSTNEDAGTFVFTSAATTATETIYQVKNGSTYTSQTAVSALLKNGAGIDPEYQTTAGTPAKLSYCYMDNRWSNLIYFDCFAAELDMAVYGEEVEKKEAGQEYDLGRAVTHLYIKPQEWLEITGKLEIDYSTDPSEPYIVEATGNADHTFSDANGEGRLFILMPAECQWWEVENVDNLYHCLHPNNDTYYYWGTYYDEELLDDVEGWMEKKYVITWLDWDGTPIKSYDQWGYEIDYEVPYGTQAEYLGSNPTREPDIDYTYDFTGWSPALGKVTSDVTYTATYTKKERKYTIIFREEGGVEIERQFLTHNAVPVCENMPTKAGHYLEWQPAIAAVSGDATYTAHWLEEKPDEWDVTFLNNAGDTLQATQKVSVEANPVYSGSTPAKENADHTPYTSAEYDCTFWGWNVVIDGAIQTYAAGALLPKPTDNMTFTAVYTMTEKTYNITFLDENGDEIETTAYHYGETPVCSDTPTKEPDAQNTYSFAWDPQIQTVMGEQTYRATFTPQTNKYTVSLKTSTDVKMCELIGAGIYDYGEEVTVKVVLLDDEALLFEGWAEAPEYGTEKSITFTVTGDVTLTAKVSLTDQAAEEMNVHSITIPYDMDAGEIPEDAGDILVQDFVMQSNGVSSAQVKGAISNLKIFGNAYFELIQSINGRQWYAVAVPWPVDAATGIFDAADNHLTLGTDFDLITFNSAAHAAGLENRDCWSYLEYQADKTMQPGKLYMIYFAANQTKIRFQKKAKAALLTERVNVQTYPSAVDAQHANWNAIANPSLYYAYLNEGGTHIGQLYNPGADDYTEINLSSQSLIVGQPVFVQAPAAKTIVAYDNNTSYASHAPRRMPAAAAEEAFYTVEISRDGMLNGRLFVAAAEEKEDTYTIGEDVMKMGVSARKAQMWIERYGVRLCMNTAAFADYRAEYPLAIYAPVAGEYTIAAPATETSATALYLTCDGEAIWNLSNGAYTLSLERGTTHSYGLRISARSPQVATGCDEVIADGAEQAQKVLVGDRLYIIRGDKVYTPAGQVVK